MTRHFLDTNILVYAHQEGDPRCPMARQLLLDGGVIGVQVLNEFASVARTKLRFSCAKVREAIQSILILCPAPPPLSVDIHLRALGISDQYGISIWDGLIVAAALQARCSLLYTEDLQHGQIIEGLKIVNPFLT